MAAHYGSISIVTFVAATEALKARLTSSGHLVALAALMETPAIISALLMVQRSDSNASVAGAERGELMREVLSTPLLSFSLASIGWIAGEEGMVKIAPFYLTFSGFASSFRYGPFCGPRFAEGWRQLDLVPLHLGFICR